MTLLVLRKATRHPAGAGWGAVPGGKKGGYRRPKAGGGFEYWYPDQATADAAAAEHRGNAEHRRSMAQNARAGGRHDDADRGMARATEQDDAAAAAASTTPGEKLVDAGNPHKGKRTLGPDEGKVWTTVADLFAHETGEQVHIHHEYEPAPETVTVRDVQGKQHVLKVMVRASSSSGFAGYVSTRKRPVFGPDGRQDPKKLVDEPFEVVLQVPVGAVNREHLLSECRRVLSHELAHAMDNLTSAHRKRSVSATESREDGLRGYYNNPTEFVAYRHNIHRELNTPEVAEETKQHRDLFTNSKEEAADTRAYMRGIGDDIGTIAEPAGRPGLGADRVAAILERHSPTWAQVSPYLNAANRRKMLSSAAAVLQAHHDDRSSPMRKCRLVLRISMQKAEQLGLFGTLPMRTGPVKRVPVKPHLRHTGHGTALVTAHQRLVHERPPEPEPVEVQPSPEPAPGLQVSGASDTVPVEVPMGVAEIEPKAEETIGEDGPAPTPREESIDPQQPARLPVYAYRQTRGEFIPPGFARIAEGSDIVAGSEALRAEDAGALGLHAVDLEGNSRDLDAYEIGYYTRQEDTINGGEPYQVFTAGRPARTVFLPLSSLWRNFTDKFDKLVERCKKLGLEPPTYTVVGETTRKVPVEVTGWGAEARTRYETRTAKIVHMTAPTVKIDGWTAAAVIKPVPGTEKSTVTRIGQQKHALPLRFWSADMHCDHCGTDRDRGMVVALRSHSTGKWQQVGGSCLKDYTGVSPANLLAMSESLDLSQDGDDSWDSYDEGGGGGRGGGYDLDDVLKAAIFFVEEDGAYVSRAKAVDAGIMATADRVGQGLNGVAPKDDPGLIDRVRAAMRSDRYTEQVTAIRAFMRGLSAERTEYAQNLHAFADAAAVPSRALGLVASAVSAYSRSVADKAPRTTAGHFGKVGDKIGRAVSKKDAAAGITGHPPIRVKVTGVHGFESDYGPQTFIVARDAAGHVFKWKASGVPEWANKAAHSGADQYADGVYTIKPGEHYDLVATIKKHGDYKGTAQTEITRAELHRAITPSEQAEFDAIVDGDLELRQTKRAKLREMIPKIQAMAAEYRAQYPDATDRKVIEHLSETIPADDVMDAGILDRDSRGGWLPSYVIDPDYGKTLDEPEDPAYLERLRARAIERAYGKMRDRAAVRVDAPVEGEPVLQVPTKKKKAAA